MEREAGLTHADGESGTMPGPLFTHWTPLRTEALPIWGARALQPGPTLLAPYDLDPAAR